MFEFFDLDNLIPIGMLICLLKFVGGQMSDGDWRIRWWTRGLAGAGFLIFAVLGLGHYKPAEPLDFAALVLRAILVMGTVNALSSVLVPVTLFFHFHLWSEPRRIEKALAAEKLQQETAEKFRLEEVERHKAERELVEEQERRRREEIANRPPPPTREERMATAKKRHDDTVHMLETAGLDGMELQAGKEKAKQDMLRAIDEAMR